MCCIVSVSISVVCLVARRRRSIIGSSSAAAIAVSISSRTIVTPAATITAVPAITIVASAERISVFVSAVITIHACIVRTASSSISFSSSFTVVQVLSLGRLIPAHVAVCGPLGSETHADRLLSATPICFDDVLQLQMLHAPVDVPLLPLDEQITQGGELVVVENTSLWAILESVVEVSDVGSDDVSKLVIWGVGGGDVRDLVSDLLDRASCFVVRVPGSVGVAKDDAEESFEGLDELASLLPARVMEVVVAFLKIVVDGFWTEVLTVLFLRVFVVLLLPLCLEFVVSRSIFEWLPVRTQVRWKIVVGMVGSVASFN